MVAEVDGVVRRGAKGRHDRHLWIEPLEGGAARHYGLPRDRHVVVSEGDVVLRGDPLIAGDWNPHDFLRLFGRRSAGEALVRELAELFSTSPGRIDNRHIEVLVRAMLAHVRIVDGGDTYLLPTEIVLAAEAQRQSAGAMARGGRPAVVAPVLTGVDRTTCPDRWATTTTPGELGRG